MGMTFSLIDHTQECIDAKNAAVEAALEAIGIQAESHAKRNLKASGHIDTGLLRNSISHAVSGEVPGIGEAKKNDYKADKSNVRYTSGKNKGQRIGANSKKIDPEKDINNGEYTEAVPDAPANRKAVYIGTNVEYAPYIEYGTSRMKGEATHFIKNAVADNTAEYEQITKKYLKGEL